MRDVLVGVARNAPCPCGSGKRYKHCHGLEAEEASRHGGPHRAASLAGSVLPQSESAAAEDLFSRGNAALQSNDLFAAIQLFQSALLKAPKNPALLNNFGLAVERNGDLVAAENAFRQATLVDPTGFDSRANLAQNLYRQHRFQEALAEFNRLIASFPVRHATLWANRAICQVRCGDQDGSVASFRRAIDLAPNIASLHADLGALLSIRGELEESRNELTQCLELDPDNQSAARLLAGVQIYLADWTDYAQRRTLLLSSASSSLGSGDQLVAPFNVQAICDDPALELRLARIWMSGLAAAAAPTRRPARPRQGTLRLGFISRDLFDHPVGRLAVGLLEQIDRSLFSVAAYGIGDIAVDPIRQRIARAADRFCAIDQFDAASIAQRIEQDEIDVLFDLNGFTGRVADVFARRPAPMQVNFLGYTGTLGLDCYDFIVADRYCIGEQDRQYYCEAPLYVDSCYLPSDDARSIDAATLNRAAYGLSDASLVLCAPAAAYKITPDMFHLWLRLLELDEGAVLWLRAHPESVMARLRAEASRRSVDPARLIFAPREDSARYAARFKLADLMLDTYPFGAHTSVNDALYVGRPVITLAGKSFASRASASQLRAAGIAELVANSEMEYFDIARRLMGDASLRGSVEQQLIANSRYLFDTKRYARDFEAALLSAWTRLTRDNAGLI